MEIETTSVRKYNTEYAAHLLGYTGAITSETWPTYKEKGGYTMNDYVASPARVRLRILFERHLGTRAIERNENGKIISSSGSPTVKPGRVWHPSRARTFLTIDIDLQEQVENILANGVAGAEQGTEARPAWCWT